nr:MAG: major capsid protein [Microvirus sp.]
MKSAQRANHTFAKTPAIKINRSSFNRDHSYKTAFNSGDLIPIFLDEALPGDTFNLNMTGFARMATPIYPLMDNLYMETFFFFIPNRLVWDNWQKFMGEQIDPGDSIDFTIPTISAQPVSTLNTIWDYMGIPTDVTFSMNVNALPFRAYNLVYNEWFRDQNLQDSITVDKDDGPDTAGNYVLRKRGKRHDYFTSALIAPQKGESVVMPLGDRADVASDTIVGNQTPVYNTLDSLYHMIDTSGGTATVDIVSTSNPANALYADLSTATAATINQLRQAFQVQKLLEMDARGGTRYVEIIKSHFGVTSPDQRLQRPEFLGGGSSPINISAVAQTSSTDATSPQGNLSATGTANLHNHGFTKSFTEHGYVLGLINVRADLGYQQGMNKLWSRETRYDFYFPALSIIGEQAILNREIFADGGTGDDTVFGYQERYAEYRYKPSMVTGILRSNAAGTLDAWHLAQDFASAPTLSSAFIEDSPPVNRVIAVQTQPEFIFDSFIKLQCARPMPVYGIPGGMDRF